MQTAGITTWGAERAPGQESPPLVSIVLPTYDRAKFLPQALESIRSQTWTDWELVIVDDGSHDETPAVVRQLTAGADHPVRYVWQENGGPAAACNAGLDLARGKYVAFLDSDDYWLPHHLKECVEALEGDPAVAWVFCAGTRVNYLTKRVLIEHDFYKVDWRPRFLSMRTRRSGDLRVFDDPRLLRCALRGGGFGGLQSTVARREVFARLRFQPVAFFEDCLALIRAIALGITIGYLTRSTSSSTPTTPTYRSPATSRWIHASPPCARSWTPWKRSARSYP
jgi:glycosyltransferase involved in cell wall biosynthesis